MSDRNETVLPLRDEIAAVITRACQGAMLMGTYNPGSAADKILGIIAEQSKDEPTVGDAINEATQRGLRSDARERFVEGAIWARRPTEQAQDGDTCPACFGRGTVDTIMPGGDGLDAIYGIAPCPLNCLVPREGSDSK